MPISQIICPILSRKFGEGKEIGVVAVKKLLPVFTLTLISFLVFINLFKFQIVSILFGVNFLPMLPMVSILSFGVFAVFYGVFIGGQVMLNLGMDRAFLKIQVYIAVVSLAINVLFISKGGGFVTSIVWTMSEIIISFYQVAYLQRKGVRLFTWKMLSITSITESIKYVLKKG